MSLSVGKKPTKAANAETLRDKAKLNIDPKDKTRTRMLAKDGSVWPMVDTGYRYVTLQVVK